MYAVTSASKVKNGDDIESADGANTQAVVLVVPVAVAVVEALIPGVVGAVLSSVALKK